MNNDQLLKALNFFLVLETQQVELYGSQSKSTEDYNLAKFLNRFKEIEQDHVNNIAKLIKKFGGTPSPAYKMAGVILGEGVKIAGSAFASYTKVENMLRVNLIGEKIAIRDYKRLINKVQDPHVQDILWRHMIDEELHMKWMDARIKEMIMKRQAVKTYRKKVNVDAKTAQQSSNNAQKRKPITSWLI
jgi:bacterioferritin